MGYQGVDMTFGDIDSPYFHENGFVRKKCRVSDLWFWTRDHERTTSGDTDEDEYTFIGAPIVKGFDQSNTTVTQADGCVRQESNHFVGKIDGNLKQIGSKYTSDGLTLGIKNGNYEYVCLLDADVIFLNDWVDHALPLAEKYFFIANRWDPGTLFKECKNNISYSISR